MLEQLQKLTDPLARKITNMLAIGVVKVIYKSGDMQRLQAKMLEGELRDKLKHYQPYGMSIHPHPGSEALALFPNGDKAEGLVITVNDRRYYLQVERGEVAIYDDLSQKVHLTREGIKIVSTKAVDIDAPVTRFSGDAVIAGNVSAKNL